MEFHNINQQLIILIAILISVQKTHFQAIQYVIGTPRILIETGNTDRYADYQSGSGTKILVFRYAVQYGDSSEKLDYVSKNSLELNGGTIKYDSGDDVILTLPEPGNLNSLSYSKNIVIYTNRV